MSNGLINRKACKDTILRMCKEMRLGWTCTQVSKQALDDLETKVRMVIQRAVHSHPSVGKTFKHVI
jgi:hypothetical protein